MLEIISDVIDTNVTEQMKKMITVTCDESTDTLVHHKLAINYQVVGPLTLAPQNVFLSDVRITDNGIFEAITRQLAFRGINLQSVDNAQGTDGASVMTGEKEVWSFSLFEWIHAL